MTGVESRPGQGEVEFQRGLYVDPNPTRRGLHLARRDWVLDQALGYSTEGDKVLEVGVGCGIFTEALSQAGRIISAVDINQAFLDNVSQVRGVTTHNKDATRQLNLGRHRLAICSEVLEHVPPESSQGMLDALFDSLEPGGVLVLTTPQRYSSVELGARLLRFKPMLALARKLYGSADELGHINLLTAAQLERQIEIAGFTVEGIRRFGFYLPLVAEFGGALGARTLRGLERLLRPIPLARGLLWTQGRVLRRPRAS